MPLTRTHDCVMQATIAWNKRGCWCCVWKHLAGNSTTIPTFCVKHHRPFVHSSVRYTSFVADGVADCKIRLMLSAKRDTRWCEIMTKSNQALNITPKEITTFLNTCKWKVSYWRGASIENQWRGEGSGERVTSASGSYPLFFVSRENLLIVMPSWVLLIVFRGRANSLYNFDLKLK